jgi:hypothetical protein
MFHSNEAFQQLLKLSIAVKQEYNIASGERGAGNCHE